MAQSLTSLALLLLLPWQSACDFGGHDLFTSLAQLEVLWHNDIKIVKEMETLFGKNENITQTMKNYIDEHNRLQLATEPNYAFLGHPLNAYHFVRHVGHGWTKIKRALTNVDLNATNDYDLLVHREKEKLPGLVDVEGAAFGLVRLYGLYRFDLRRFVDEGVISTTLDNGQVVLSEPSVLKVTSYDLAMMSTEASANGLYDASCDMMEAAVNQSRKELAENIDLSFLVDYAPDPDHLEELLKTARKVHDHKLDTRGSKDTLHRTHQKPYDAKLRKKKKFKKAFDLDQWAYSRQEIEVMVDASNNNEDVHHKFKFISEMQMDTLCRGNQIRSPAVMGKLYCHYAHNDSPWLRLGPIKVEINSFDPYHVVLHEILFDEECDGVTRFLGPRLDFPPGRMNFKSQKNDWTMKNCWPDEEDHPGLKKLNRRIEHLAGLKADSSKGYSEGFMCGNYGIGGFYFIHPDFHNPGNPMGAGGNRMATILTVFQSPEAGGATVWPNAGISVFPKKGSAAFWYNIRTSDIPDQYTMHAACPVLLGQKWIGNKWVGYNGQWDGRKCKLGFDDRFDGIPNGPKKE